MGDYPTTTGRSVNVEEYYEKAEAIKGSQDPRAFLGLAIWAREQKASRFVTVNISRVNELGRAMEAAGDLLKLAEMARDAGLGAEVRPLWERLLALDRDNEVARRALGYRRHQNEWLTEEEYQAALGNVMFEGKWISPGERNLILEERAQKLAERAKEIEKREARALAAEKSAEETARKIAAASEKLDKTRAKLEQDRKELEEREKALKQRENQGNGYMQCGTCGFFYTGVHICPKVYTQCPKCGGYFKGPHDCPKK